MSTIGSIGRTAYNIFIKTPTTFWTGKKEEEVNAAHTAAVYAGAALWPITALLSLGGCGVDEKAIASPGNTPVPGDSDPDDINITPGDGDGVIVMNEDYLIEDLGSRIQDGGEIETVSVGFAFSGAKNKTVKIIIESVPENLNPALADLDGIIDVTPIAERPDAFNLGTADAPVYIRDPFDPNNRLPVFMGTLTLKDNTGKINDRTTEVCSAEQLAAEACGAETRIGATGGIEIAPYTYLVPKEAYSDNQGDLKINFTPRIDASNYNPGSQYDFRLRIRMVIE